MSSGTPEPEKPKCIRCGEPLPPGTGFCVACGCNNDSALLERRAAVEAEAHKRIERAKARGWFFRALRIFGRR